ncbi:MFS transporter [Streptomyces meridianus]|uniref:MFS transporter n=1 Tax=Streptomyces meridianus TaxID=2938945 RepID=A0ABT0XAM9_9ACTN|nr:MFS transporter [Streptomyces meridianus]MCM2579580.1 MFS transporter [Streptomyces meridianus]
MHTQFFSAPRSARIERHRHALLAAGVFLVLGFHVGVWAVELPRLADALHLEPGALGAAVSASAAAGIVTLFGGGRLADRFGRRPVLLAGFGGTAAAFVSLAQVRSTPMLILVFVLYGLTVSFIDLGANTVGSDYERTHGRQAMTGLHAGFSLGALLGALASSLLLWAGAGFRTVYVLLAVVLALTALITAVASLPTRNAGHQGAEAGGAASARPERPVWRELGVVLAMGAVTVTFFGDGALESFLGVFLTRWNAPDGVLTGIGIGGYHLASLIGRLGSVGVQQRWGERRLLFCAGILAAAGMTAVVESTTPVPAICGLLAVGAAVAPVVPLALSLAGRSVPGHAGKAVALTTAVGYSAFVAGPALIGALADATSLRTALALLIVTSLTVSALAVRWPARTRVGGPDGRSVET